MCVFIYTNYCTPMLLPFTFMLMYLGVNWQFLHTLLNHSAAFVFNSFFLVLSETIYSFWPAGTYIFNIIHIPCTCFIYISLFIPTTAHQLFIII